MTAAASLTDASPWRTADAAARRRRLGVVAVACAIAASIHVLGWFVLRWASTTTSAARPEVGAPAWPALSVVLIPARPVQPPATGVTGVTGVAGRTGRTGRTGQNGQVRGNGRSPERSGAAANARMPARSLPEAFGALHARSDAPAGVAPDGRDNRPANASMPNVDWGRDLASIGARRASGRSAADAAIDALGASSGHVAPRRDTVGTRLATGMSDAHRVDCRSAYSGAGLLALPMLALDAVRDTGCKW
ncbi:hypothetical protein DM992_12025 [Burkholderia sp. JP2-270]|uniref:hypothetical protein n=1 Tax=Burkholderia sp. JP2-270 TaxID=2217913 RepID=UPI000DA371D2|nr:hypothetical protein [Burkholderia sp. JP2-270]AWV00186.1 hypothetical protein DM992_12025 [Burkholderia sp. JP2-270]